LVLDLACGHGRHAIAAAALGARVVAIDRDPDRLAAAESAARAAGVSVDWRLADLDASWPSLGTFGAVLCFNYLARERMADMRELLAQQGVLMMETFLASQVRLGWGPTSEAHLLQPGELNRLVQPLQVLHGREALEPVGGERYRLVASVLARRLDL
jgi:cyclopropane fatty-acyl-phospholipid synthase-like methyltransferase